MSDKTAPGGLSVCSGRGDVHNCLSVIRLEDDVFRIAIYVQGNSGGYNEKAAIDLEQQQMETLRGMIETALRK